jgi:Tfp pilus assembly protein PilN
MSNESNEFSFLPDDYCDRSVRRRLSAAAIAILAIFAIATVVAAYVSEESLKHVARVNGEVTLAFDQAVARGGQATKLRDESESLAQRALRMSALASGIPSSNILAELTNALPPATSLTSIGVTALPRSRAAIVAPTAFDLKKTALESKRQIAIDPIPEIPPTDIIVRISGAAENNVAISQIVENLSKSPAFADVRLVGSEINAVPGKEKTAARRFQIEARFNAAAKFSRPLTGRSTAAINDDDADADADAGDVGKEMP